jgi:alpha-N-arabinofuranosidase
MSEKIIVNGNRSVGTIDRHLYGQFSEHLGRCVYEGLYVGDDKDIPHTKGMRNDVVSALKALSVPVMRWPGGCFADTYHWMDGIGEKSERRRIVNTNWGGVTEDNSFGTDEFMTLAGQIGCDAYFSGNVGSGSPREMSDWVEYCNSPAGSSPMALQREKNGRKEPYDVLYWGIGNEAWGCGGSMRAEYYADLLRQYSTYLRTYHGEKIVRIASGASEDDYHWTKVIAEQASRYIDMVSLHYYTRPLPEWSHKGAATRFPVREYYSVLANTLRMEELIVRHGAIISKYDKSGRVRLAVDEWGTWYDAEEGTNPGFLLQQNTIRDALVAAINLNLFNNHADIVGMANIAQVANVLQAMVLTEGPRMILTPTYHVFGLMKGHQGARQVETYAASSMVGVGDFLVPSLSVSASVKAQKLLVTVANLSLDPIDAEILLEGLGEEVRKAECRMVSGEMDSHNDFGNPNKVHIVSKPVSVTGTTLALSLPPSSVASVEVILG